MTDLQWLQQWYAGQCDEDWEHVYGVEIGTLDNPGWRVRIDLTWTDLEGATFPRHRQGCEDEESEDWIDCWVNENVFEGVGGPFKLEEILGRFRRFHQEQSKPRTAADG